MNTAWTAGVLFGKASNYRTWEAGFAYEVLEKDAIFGQFVDSDFGDGVTDTQGWVLRAGYAPLRNWTMNATYFINDRNVDVPQCHLRFRDRLRSTAAGFQSEVLMADV